ncbi:hypothetical protein BBJ28_00004727 [Nothophytophthora sp. Chile5]|nr:hypothetical protein BBJ28_00004727 [Nothophytophthora sp. Chile5]
MNAGIHVLDLTTNSWSSVMIAGEAASPITRALTARCCATVLTMQLPIDEATGMLRRIKEGEELCEPQEAVVIFGGFSEYESALAPSSMLVLEVNHSRLREVQVPSARLKSYMAHATAVCPGQRAFLVFGGTPTPEDGESDMTPHQFLDTTMALNFWKTPADFPSEADEEAAREAAQNPIKTKTLGNGDLYVGEMNQALTQRHGKGKCSYANGDEYDGDWRDDQRCGQGAMRYASSQDVYAGQWERDQRHGYGIYEYNTPPTHANDRQKTRVSNMQQRQPKKYEGQWADDVKHGSGTLTFSDGSQLVGSWASDVLETREESRLEGFDDGQHGPCSYVGEVLDGVPHGRGESHHEATGDVYVGSWMAGRRSGHGVVTLRDGSVYRGEWRNGRRNGFGLFDDARTRARYDGKWVGDVRCGRGVCTYANGCSYEGDWQDDARHGAGRYLFADGSCFDGAWQSDNFCGDGSFVLCIDNDASASVLQPDDNGQE